MSMDSILIVGGGAAGLAAVETLRSQGYAGALTMVCDEPELPYDRPPLSKQVLTGAWDAERTRFREAAHYADLGIRLVRGQAGALDADGRTVYLSDGYPLRFDGLIIATGVRPRRLPGGHDLAGVHVLRDHPDVAALRATFASAPRVAIVGGGFLGMEVAAAARGLGLDVTVIEPLAQPMIRQVGPVIGAEVARLHREHGVDLRTGIGVSGLEGDGGVVTGVALTDGSVVPADCVVVAIGAVPATDWLRTSGLAIGDGVECDEFCRAAPGIYAAGDVASWVNPRYQRRMRIEHRMNATEQGTAAAVNLLNGRRAAVRAAAVLLERPVQRQAPGARPPVGRRGDRHRGRQPGRREVRRAVPQGRGADGRARLELTRPADPLPEAAAGLESPRTVRYELRLIF